MTPGPYFFIAVALAMALSACSSSGSRTNKGAPAETVIGSGDGAGSLSIGSLADAAIPAGECGMILWTLEAQQPAAVFRMVSGKGGEIVINGAKTALTLTQSGGASGFGVSEEQAFASGGVRISVKMRFGLGFEGGTYLERGLLTVEDASGWRTVIPAAGVAGCRNK